MSYLEIKDVQKKYGKVMALANIDMSVEKGEFVCVLGPSGCGKSTLLRVLAGLESIESGAIVIGGRDVTKEPPASRNFGIVFQSYALFPNMTVSENVGYGLKNRRTIDAKEIKERVKKMLDVVSLSPHANKYPQELSGGQQQRVALARAIILEPDFLLLDEPLSALDAKVRLKLRREIRELQQRLKITTIMVTHDQEEALALADKIVVMNNSVIEQIGTPEEVYETPKTGFVADFIGMCNFIDETHAIRPENVSISSDTQSLSGKITDIEYRGAFYRLTIESSMGEITIDLKSDVRKRICLESGTSIFFELDKNNLIRLDRAV